MFFVADFTGVANAFWLPWLIEGLEKEDIIAPAKRSTDAFLEESFRIFIIGFCDAVVGAT